MRCVLDDSRIICRLLLCHNSVPDAQHFWAEVSGRPTALSGMIWLQEPWTKAVGATALSCQGRAACCLVGWQPLPAWRHPLQPTISNAKDSNCTCRTSVTKSAELTLGTASLLALSAANGAARAQQGLLNSQGSGC